MKAPSAEDVLLYWHSAGLLGHPEEFFDHFTSNGWRVGRTPMVDWKAAARNWSRNEVKWGRAQIGAKVATLIDTADADREAEAQARVTEELAEMMKLRKERGL
jgi:hypothetical protein